MKQVFVTLALWVFALPVWAEIEIKEVTSASGITAWLVEDHSIPFVALELRFAGGASLDDPGKRGAVNLMTALLEEGAADMDARAYARKTEELAASFRFRVNSDSLQISARFLTENRDAALEHLRAAIKEPRFDADAIERVRAQVVSGIRSDANDPNKIARTAFNAMAHGDHPYGSDLNGSLESVAALTRDDLLAAHAAVFARDRLFVGAVGDVSEDDLGAILDALLGDLPEAGAPLPEPAPVTIAGGTTVVEFETPQSVAMFGHAGIAREDPDFFAAFVMNHILGGGSFESRLMEEVREKRGLTYGVYSYLSSRKYAATYLGSVATSNDRVAESIEVIRAEWARMASEGVTEEELDAAKTYLTGAYPLRFDGNGPIARMLAGLQFEGLPIDYVATRNDQVNAVTLEDVNRVAQSLLQPEALHFVVVGQPQGLDQPGQ